MQTNNTPSTEHIMCIEVTIGKPQMLGKIATGTRINYPILSGQFKGKTPQGDWCQGNVLPGVDFFLEQDDGTGIMNALYSLKDAHGNLINIHNTGLFNPTEVGKKSLDEGHWPIPEEQLDCRCTPFFEVASGPMQWLNQKVFTGRVRYPSAEKVVIDVYQLLF